MFKFHGGDIDVSHQPGFSCKFSSDIEWMNAEDPDSVWLITQHQTDFTYIIDDIEYTGTACQMLIFAPSHVIWHGPLKNSKQGFVDDWVIIEGKETQSLLSELCLPQNTAFDISNHKILRPFIKRLRQERTPYRIGRELAISNIIGDMLIEIGRQHEDDMYIDNPQRLMLSRIRKEMFSDFSKPWSIKELSTLSGYSPSHFCALYQQFYGVSPIDDLLKYRIMIAKDELMKNNLSVTEISQKCGFSSIHHFSHSFKKYVGVPPSVFGK